MPFWSFKNGFPVSILTIFIVIIDSIALYSDRRQYNPSLFYTDFTQFSFILTHRRVNAGRYLIQKNLAISLCFTYNVICEFLPARPGYAKFKSGVKIYGKH